MNTIGDSTLPCLPSISNEPLKFCIGALKVNFGSWYVPNGKTPQEFTYCEYCIANGCSPREKVYKMEEKPVNTNCDCIKQKIHPLLKTIECPACKFKSIGMCRMASCGICSNCNVQIPYCGQKYCAGCSWTLKACHECGEEITEGSSYLEKMNQIIQKRLKRFNGDMYEEEQRQSVTAIYLQRYNNMASKISNKSKEEMLKLLSVNNPEDPY